MRLEVVDGATVGTQGIDQRADGSLLHTGIARDHCTLAFSGGLHESADGGEETGGGSGVAQVDFFALFGDREGTCTSIDNQGFTTIFPRELGTLE